MFPRREKATQASASDHLPSFPGRLLDDRNAGVAGRGGGGGQRSAKQFRGPGEVRALTNSVNNASVTPSVCPSRSSNHNRGEGGGSFKENSKFRLLLSASFHVLLCLGDASRQELMDGRLLLFSTLPVSSLSQTRPRPTSTPCHPPSQQKLEAPFSRLTPYQLQHPHHRSCLNRGLCHLEPPPLLWWCRQFSQVGRPAPRY